MQNDLNSSPNAQNNNNNPISGDDTMKPVIQEENGRQITGSFAGSAFGTLA